MEHKKCGGVLGYDANALYLWAIQQEMPSGWFYRRKAENAFKPETQKFNNNSNEAYLWLCWLQNSTDTNIRTAFNQGEKRIGSRHIPVDGFDRTTRTIYQFHGCWWHGHNCKEHHKDHYKELMNIRRENTIEITAYLRRLGYTVIEMWECAWYTQKKTCARTKKFLSANHPTPSFSTPWTKHGIIKRIKDGSLFGMVECDIHVPDSLREHFSEMTPIFKNTEIAKDDIGETMRTYADTNNLLNQPRKSLIGSYFGKKLLLTTPLLHWYIKHGLKITHIYQVIEYEKSTCFFAFGEDVADARRTGDIDFTKAILADTFKLLGILLYKKNKIKKQAVSFFL